MSGEWSNISGAIGWVFNKGLSLYDPLLGNVCKSSGPPTMPPEEINPNRANLLSSISQQAAAHLTPQELTGLTFTWTSPIGQRMTRTHAYKFVGQGNPMLGKPGSGLETSLNWAGGSNTAMGPAWQCMLGPFNLNSLYKGKLDSQVIYVGNNSTNVFINSWDSNTWAVFMAINQLQGKLSRDHHFKFKSNVQCPGGVAAFSRGQAVGEFEVAYCPTMWPKRFNLSVGAKWAAELGFTLDHLKRLPLSVLTADPFLVMKHTYPPFAEDKGLDNTNIVTLGYNRQQQKINCEILSFPEKLQEQLVEMNIKAPTFMKGLPKEARQEHFRWAAFERNSYKVKGEMDLKSKLFGYCLGINTKWIGRGSEFTVEFKADPGSYFPHKMTAVLSENTWLNKETPMPLTTDLSMSYDTATPERPPRFGVNFNLNF